MNTGAYIKMARNGQIPVDCSQCGDTKKGCFRRRIRSLDRTEVLYLILPCAYCNAAMLRGHPLFHPAIETSNEWRNQNERCFEVLEQLRTAAQTRTPVPDPMPFQDPVDVGSDSDEDDN